MNGIYMYMYMHVYVYMYFHDTCTLYVCMSGKLVHMISVSLGCISKLFLTITNVSEQKQLLCYSLMATFEHKRLSNRSVVDKLFIGCYAWQMTRVHVGYLSTWSSQSDATRKLCVSCIDTQRQGKSEIHNCVFVKLLHT